jgi:uncharacterized protein (TIRG00374 family)
VTALLGSRPVRVAVAAALLTYLLWLSNPAEVASALGRARLGPVAIAVALTLVDRTMMAFRWVALLGPLPPDVRPPLATVIRLFFVSTFVGTFLPASVGGDAVRAYGLSAHRVPLSLSVASVAMDRALGIVSILLLGVSAVLLAPPGIVPGVAPVFAAGAAACLALGALVFSERAAAAASRLVSRLVFAPAARAVQALIAAVREYRHERSALGVVLAASVGVQVIRVLQAYFLGLALDIPTPLGAYFVAIPLILLVMLLPITINGLGTSQAAFLWCFGALGVPRSAAFALSVLFVALGIVGNLPGGMLYATGGRVPQGT